jgi:flavin reductase (DIM6/NTAB) family NADH-FMN oxidoreductase RutF
MGYEPLATPDAIDLMPAGLFVMTAAHGGRDNWQFVVRGIGISAGPPTIVLVGLSPRNLTTELAEASGEFVLAVCSTAQAGAVVASRGLTGHKTEDKFAAVGMQRLPATQVQAPLIADARACLECRIQSKFPAGDRQMYVAEVVAVHHDPKANPVVHYDHLVYTFLDEANHVG